MFEEDQKWQVAATDMHTAGFGNGYATMTGMEATIARRVEGKSAFVLRAIAARSVDDRERWWWR